MTLLNSQITNLRNLTAVTLEDLSPSYNIFYGANGSGKTSLLEAMHVLSLGRSFRAGSLFELIAHDADALTVFASLQHAREALPTAIGLEKKRHSETKWRLNQKTPSSVAEIASLLPVRVLNTASHALIEEGPLSRRQFLDWGAFYLFDDFFSYLKRFQAALKQRNMLLREMKLHPAKKSSALKQALQSWTVILVEAALAVTRFRKSYLQKWQDYFYYYLQTLLPGILTTLVYVPGYDEDNYSEQLAAQYGAECGAGHTLSGPHRADLQLLIHPNIPAKHYLSRGQQKLLVAAMMLAQGALLHKEREQSVMYLVDDLPAELDSASRARLLPLFLEQQSQVFITTIEPESVDCAFLNQHRDLTKHLNVGLL